VKRVLSSVLCLCLLSGLTAGCGWIRQTNAQIPENTAAPGAATGAPETAPPETPVSLAKSGVFRKLYSSEYTTLNYLKTVNTLDLKAVANIIDGLVEYDNYGVVLPALAESWSSNEDNTVWTFKIRQGVKWVDKNGIEAAEVTAQDWVDTARYINDARNKCPLQRTYEGYIKNASVYYAQTAEAIRAEEAVAAGKAASADDYYRINNIDPSQFITFDDVGVKALDKYTLEYTMETPSPFFISMLSYASYLPVYGPFLEKQGDNFGAGNRNLLFNGAYILTDCESDVRHVFMANRSYWDRGKVYIPEYDEIYNSDEITLAPELFRDGEVSEAAIGADILDKWFTDSHTKNLVRGNMPVISYSYFYAFNFEPRFDAQYEPDNWKIAVNNENFRQALMYGLDRVSALAVTDQYNPELLVNNTITPAMFTAGAGKDFTQYDALKAFSDSNSFDKDKALAYRDHAKNELSAAGATFPIKILMPYNPSIPGWETESKEVKQQLETLLGFDFIDIIPEAGPATGFLDSVRRTGGYAFMKCNWGADYADPQTWTEPFTVGNSYNFMYTDEKKVLNDMPAINKSAETQAAVTEYYGLVNAAKAQTADIAQRYGAFANAEAYLLRHALAVPFSVDSMGYTASLADPFSYMFAPYGLSPYRYKGVKLLKKPMSDSEFKKNYADWKKAWTKAQAAVSG